MKEKKTITNSNEYKMNGQKKIYTRIHSCNAERQNTIKQCTFNNNKKQ